MPGEGSRRLKVEIARIPDTGLALKREDSPFLYRLEDVGIVATEAVRFQGKIIRTSNGACLKGSVETVLQLECARCLRSFPFRIQSDVIAHFARHSEEKTVEHEKELTREDMETYCMEGEEIDLLGPVRDQVVVSVPIKPLCEPDCPGLCPVCGRPLKDKKCTCRPEAAVDPGPAVLEKLIKRKE